MWNYFPYKTFSEILLSKVQFPIYAFFSKHPQVRIVPTKVVWNDHVLHICDYMVNSIDKLKFIEDHHIFTNNGTDGLFICLFKITLMVVWWIIVPIHFLLPLDNNNWGWWQDKNKPYEAGGKMNRKFNLSQRNDALHKY